MKLINKGIILAALLATSHIASASKITAVKLAITNNMLLSFNLIINGVTTNLSPVVERFGGTATWTVSATDGQLNAVDVFYSAKGTTVPCLSGDRTGVMAMNTALYTGDTITIVVNPSETGAPICTCIGSVCDAGV